MMDMSNADYMEYLAIEAKAQGISLAEAHQQEVDASIRIEEIMPSVEQLRVLANNGRDFSEY